MTPEFLYKYRGADLDRQVETLANDQIWMASPESLNDPFEATVVVDRDRFETFDLLAFATVQELLGISRKTKGAYQQFLEALDKFIEQVRGWGILSLTQNPLDELCWAHYADSHRGFCIEYASEQLLALDLRSEILLEVLYQERPPVLDPAELASVREAELKSYITSALIATKSLRWAHEEEWRVVSGTPGLRAHDFRAVTGLYFGYRMAEEKRRIIMERLKGRGIKYFVVEPIPGHYTLRPEALEDPFADAPKYRHSAASIAEGVPTIDEFLRSSGYEGLINEAIEIARWEPYCERVTDAYVAASRSTPDNPVFYVTCDGPGGLPRNFYVSKQQIEQARRKTRVGVD